MEEQEKNKKVRLSLLPGAANTFLISEVEAQSECRSPWKQRLLQLHGERHFQMKRVSQENESSITLYFEEFNSGS